MNMKIVKRGSTFFLVAALSFIMAAGLARPPRNALAESNQALLVQAVTDLNELRDQITDRWTLILKSGWNVYLDDKLIFPGLEKTLTDFKPRLEAAPDNRLKVESLVCTVNQMLRAEEDYMAYIQQSRSSAANCLLSVMPMITVYGAVRDQADALVLGREPLVLLSAPPDPATLEALAEYGSSPKKRGAEPGQAATIPENLKTVAEGAAGAPISSVEPPAEKEPLAGRLPRQEPSSDPETLRLAYEAMKANQSMYFQVRSTAYDVQLGMTEFVSMPTRPDYTPQTIESLMAPIRRLPGLTARDRKLIESVPETCGHLANNVKNAGEALARKQRAQADLGRLVESSLADIDDLRARYLKRLLESGN